MEEIKIIGWTNFECKYPSRNVEGDEFFDIVSLIAEQVLLNGYCFSGQDHQNSFTGVPVFSDGTCLRSSMRVWGRIMSLIFSMADGKTYSYIDFYMNCPKKVILPELIPFEVESAIIADERPGLIQDEDIELISSSIKTGTELVTFDKVIKRFIQLLKAENK